MVRWEKGKQKAAGMELGWGQEMAGTEAACNSGSSGKMFEEKS